MGENKTPRTKRRLWDGTIDIYTPNGSALMGLGHMGDLSEHGSIVDTELSLEDGQQIRLRMHLGESFFIDIEATVIRSEKNGVDPTVSYHVRFDAVTPEKFIQLKRRLSITY